MVDKLSIYNGALRELKETPLATLTDNRSIRKTLDTAYDEAVRFCLESGVWTFAMRDVAITQSGTSTIGYGYTFTKPSDFLKLAGMWSDSALKTDIDDEYDEYGGTWRTNYTTIYIKYVSNDSSYGLDFNKWTGGFIAFVQKYLAFLVASTSTNSDTIKKQIFELAEDAKNKALEIDGWKKPIRRIGTVSTTPTKLSIYNGALRELSQPPLLSLNENRPIIEMLDSAYNNAIKTCLESGLWTFALKFLQINQSSVSSISYDYNLTKPSDFIKLAGIWSDSDLRMDIDDEYDEDAINIKSNYETIYIKYVSNDSSYGLDLAKWTANFIDYVQKYLAFLVAPVEAKKIVFELSENAKNKAIELDAWKKPIKRVGILGSTTPSKLSIYNGALRELSQAPLLSLNENRPAIEHLDSAYEACIQYCLENGQWNFAMRTVKLDYSVSVTPSFGYQKFFQKPTDYIKLIGIWYDEDLRQGLAENYDEDNMGWYTDYETIYVKYVSNHVNYGLNISGWTSAFTDYVQKYLALQCAIPITQSPQIRSDLIRLVDMARLNSQNLDNWNKPTKRIPQGSWTNARTRGNNNFSREKY